MYQIYNKSPIYWGSQSYNSCYLRHTFNTKPLSYIINITSHVLPSHTGAFRVEMQRDSSKDRTILCRYDPTEVGDYLVHVKWSGEHVPGSPFHVRIADTQDELERFLADGNLHSLQSNRTLESRMHNMDF